MAKTSDRVASLNPDDMIQGGLKDDFRGTVTEATYCRWDYDGNIDEPVLAARLTIQPEDDEPLVQYWSAGDLAAFVPSLDGKSESESGPYALRIGKKAQLNNNTNFAHLMSTIVDAGKASGKFLASEHLTPSLECLVGLDAHWNRVPQKKRSGLVDDSPRRREVLVVTEVYGYRAGKPSSGRPPARPDKQPADGDLDSRLESAVAEMIADAGGSLKKTKLAQGVLVAFAKDPAKAKLVKRVMQQEFYASPERPWTFDEDEGVLNLE